MKELSILILTLPTRIDSYARLIKSLNQQVIENNLISNEAKEYINIVDVNNIKNVLNLGQSGTNKKRRKKS